MTATEKDRNILARTLWGEARGESLAGQVAVACVIRNRVNDAKDRSWWGEGYAGVCLEQDRPELSVPDRREADPVPRAGAVSDRC